MRRNNGNAVGSLHLSQGPPHGGLEVIGRAKMFFNQVHKNFGVRCGRETMASTFEDRPEGSMIFNNTVVDEGYPPRAIGVRMSIRLRRHSMRCPPRMSNAERGFRKRTVERLGEVLDLSDAPECMQLIVRNDRDSGRIVSAIFEMAQPFKENRRCFPGSKISYDAAHSITLLLKRSFTVFPGEPENLSPEEAAHCDFSTAQRRGFPRPGLPLLLRSTLEQPSPRSPRRRSY